MGQRLNLEIHNDGELLANAYYHWSAYTSSSLSILEDVLKAYKKSKEIDPLKIAVEILHETGAGINETERSLIEKDTSGRFVGIDFHDAINRNEGLLSVTVSGMEDTRKFEEGRVTVDIGKEEFIFDVMWQESASEYDECPHVDENGEEIKAESLPDTTFDFTAPCSFYDYDKFAKEIKDNPHGVWIDEDTILCWIE